MTGNVWEWVDDWFDASYYNTSPSTNPKGSNFAESRVFRGGLWYNNTKKSRLSYRGINDPDYRDHGNGLGLVLIR